MKENKKNKISKEEKRIFIVIGIVVLIAIGILLAWYFIKDKDEDPKLEEPKKPVVDYSKWEIPNGVLKNVYVGQKINFLTTIIFNGKEETVTVTIQKNVGGEWINIATSDNVFVPEEAGTYRYVYTFKGVEKYQNFTVKEKEVAIVGTSVSWTLPTLPSRIAFGKELTLNLGILVNGEKGTANVTVQIKTAGKWIAFEVLNNKFVPNVGEYRYVYQFNNETKYHNFEILDWNLPTLSNIKVGAKADFPDVALLKSLGETYTRGLEYKDSGIWKSVSDPTEPLAVTGEYRYVYTLGSTTKFGYFQVLDEFAISRTEEIKNFPVAEPDTEEDYRLGIIKENASRYEAAYIDDKIEINVYGPLEKFETIRPLKTPVGIIVTFEGLASLPITDIESNTIGIYADLDGTEIWGADLTIGKVLLWIDFDEFEFNKEINIELKINDEIKIFTLVFKNFIIDKVEPATAMASDETLSTTDFDNLNANLGNIKLTYDKTNITINILDTIQPVDSKSVIGLLVALDEYKASDGYTVTSTEPNILVDLD